MDLQTITIKEYLTRKGITFKESDGELITRCLFNDCDKDSKSDEAHLYFDAETGQYHCKKCGVSGNTITLAKHLGDEAEEVIINPRKSTKNIRKYPKFDSQLVATCHQTIPDRIRQYLNARGITDALVSDYKLGWGRFYGQWWITIPIKDIEGNFAFFKLRQDPNKGNEKVTYPEGIKAQIYGWDTLENTTDRIFICEGEMDRLLLISKGIPAITSTHGAMTFKEDWLQNFEKFRKIYICFDNDETGRKGAERVAKMVGNGGNNETYLITLPEEVGKGGDITDYFVKLNGNPDDLFNKYAKEYPEKIDTSKFKPLSPQELLETLGLTIKKDEENKLITFLCELSSYTESSQFNISFNAPSSTGKSYIPTEIAQLFPEEDVLEIGYCSPTAFFHEMGQFIKEKKGYVVDLSRKILIFLDQPHIQLLERLRSLLSHDKKEIRSKITDKSQKFGLKTKNVFIRGFPAVIFCTAGLKIDEQEATRFLLLSPETNREKIREAIYEKIKKETDVMNYKKWLEENPERKLLKERILAIKQAGIKEIKIGSPKLIEQMFFEKNKVLKPRHQRDIARLISLVKSLALLNLWFREKDNETIVANEEDVKEAFKIWDGISESQELNLPPYIYNLYKEVVLPAWYEKNGTEKQAGVLEEGLTRPDILKKHFQVYGRHLAGWLLRQQIIPMWETAGLIIQEPDPDDKRKMLIYPTTPLSISSGQGSEK